MGLRLRSNDLSAVAAANAEASRHAKRKQGNHENENKSMRHSSYDRDHSGSFKPNQGIFPSQPDPIQGSGQNSSRATDCAEARICASLFPASALRLSLPACGERAGERGSSCRQILRAKNFVRRSSIQPEFGSVCRFAEMNISLDKYPLVAYSQKHKSTITPI
jgi:hypothetical protein